MSIPSSRTSKTKSNAIAWRGSSSKGSIKSSATRCRWSRCVDNPATGAAATGFSARSICFCAGRFADGLASAAGFAPLERAGGRGPLPDIDPMADRSPLPSRDAYRRRRSRRRRPADGDRGYGGGPAQFQRPAPAAPRAAIGRRRGGHGPGNGRRLWLCRRLDGRPCRRARSLRSESRRRPGIGPGDGAIG